MKKELKDLMPEEHEVLVKTFLVNLPKTTKSKIDHSAAPSAKSCGCGGCSCYFSGSGDVCDFATAAGYAGGYYGANFG